jgi:hypothetical protein
MGLLDYVAAPRQSVAYLFPETTFGHSSDGRNAGRSQLRPNSGLKPTAQISDVFVFQFWPQQVQDNYTPNYSTKNIPGASHPIFQWTSGSGRDISFTAQFVSELQENSSALTGNTRGTNSGFQSRIRNSSAANTSEKVFNAAGALLLPSSRYTVNVSAAIAALQQYLYPSYGSNNQGGPVAPPKKLILVLPNTSLGRARGADGVLCILRSAPVTQEAYFPSGELRSASLSLRFSEIVQFSTSSVSKIKYIGAEAYTALAGEYTTSINTANELTLG